MTLVRKELVRPDASMFPATTASASATTSSETPRTPPSKGDARRLHEGIADWLEQRRRALTELEELVAYHLERRFATSELGLTTSERAARRAGGERLAAAGRRAMRHEATCPAAMKLLDSGGSVLPEHHPTRRAILPELGSALMRAGDGSSGGRADGALEAAAAAGDRRLELRTLIEREFFA